MDEFTQLKRTYPVSLWQRECDGYAYIMENSTEEERIKWGIDFELQEFIEIDEKYIYEVGKIGKKFTTKSTSDTLSKFNPSDIYQSASKAYEGFKSLANPQDQ